MIGIKQAMFWQLSAYLFAAVATGAVVGSLWSEALKSRSAIAKSPESRPEPPRLTEIPSTHMICRSVKNPSTVLALSHPQLPGFRGDTQWIHRREGHVGKPYWPGGDSGITLDPGMDLGHAEPWLIEAAFEERLPRHQLNAVRGAMGVKGAEAETLLRRSGTLRGIEVSRSTAAGVFPYLLRPYWRSLRLRFSSLADPDVPPEAQTALLSLAYNRGPWNPDLSLLHLPLQTRQWTAVARIIHNMQQDHLLEGIRRRRRIESLLISNNLAFAPTVNVCRHVQESKATSFGVVKKENQEPES